MGNCNYSNSNRCSGLMPGTQYGLAKYLIGREIEAKIYNADNIYNLRIFGLFGKYENWKTTFISGACCKSIFNMPITIRQDVYFDYLFIDDFCKMLELFIDINYPKYHTYNITSGKRICLKKIAEIIKEISKKNIDIIIKNDGLANEYTSNNERILDEIGEFAFEPIKDSITKLYMYYENTIEQIDKDAIDE